MALSVWAKGLVPTLTTQLGRLGVPASAVPAFAAQLDLETARGTSSLVRSKNNVAGIGGRGNYRSYPTIDAGVAGYLSLLQNPRYKPVIDAAKTGNAEATAVALGKSPWAAHHYRLGASGDEYSGGSGTVGTEGYALIKLFGGTIPGQKNARGSASGGTSRSRASGVVGGAVGGAASSAASAIGGAATSAASSVVGSLIDFGPARKTLLSVVIVGGAVGLVVVGAGMTSKPAVERNTAQMAAWL
jgi:Mannosyl-glycoprotein endo-beta-N-acetylglucosaminidase